jgi:hypothetical protein
MLRQVIFKKFIRIIVLILPFYSCADKSCDSDKPVYTNKYFGVQITNNLLTGSMYADTAGAQYQYRSIIVDIINDTLIPVNLQIEFPNKFLKLNPSTRDKYKVFLLPDSMTTDRQYSIGADNGLVSKTLEILLDKELYEFSLKKIIRPGEKYKLRLGFLFDMNSGQTCAELFSKGHRQNLIIPEKEIKKSSTNKNTIELILDVAVNPGQKNFVSYSALTCGQLSYSN